MEKKKQKLKTFRIFYTRESVEYYDVKARNADEAHEKGFPNDGDDWHESQEHEEEFYFRECKEIVPFVVKRKLRRR